MAATPPAAVDGAACAAAAAEQMAAGAGQSGTFSPQVMKQGAPLLHLMCQREWQPFCLRVLPKRHDFLNSRIGNIARKSISK